jgi:hypothetical protein
VVLFDSWYLAEEFIACLRRRRKDWISILKKNRNLETNSFVLKDADGKRIPLAACRREVRNGRSGKEMCLKNQKIAVEVV